VQQSERARAITGIDGRGEAADAAAAVESVAVRQQRDGVANAARPTARRRVGSRAL
jgi:hypothetical protein